MGDRVVNVSEETLTTPAPARFAAAPGGVRSYLRKIFAIVAKDLTTEIRSRDMLSSMGAFAVLVIFVFAFAFDLRVARSAATAAPGVLWVVITFAGMLGLNRSLAAEFDRGSFDGLRLAPIDRSAIFIGKALGNFIFMSAIEAIVLPLFVAFFNLPFIKPMILVSVVLGTIGFASVGTLLATMAANTRLRDVLLPILMLPVALPALLAAVKCTAGALDDAPFELWGNWLGLLLAYDLALGGLAVLTFEYIVED
ncbi:MAG TPA: heme exporter protein CcmB [Anaerolineae bacterium]|nr:heme exporter protein CcmB [Anaerolineae bacterium]